MHYFRYINSYLLKLKSEETLLTVDIEHFWDALKARLFKLGLKKARKASQFSKRSSKEWLYLQRAPFWGVLFCTFLLNWRNWRSCCDFSRLQMWLQSDKVSCLKTLINTMLSTFRNISWFTPWGVFLMIFSKIHATSLTTSLCLIQFLPSISLVWYN